MSIKEITRIKLGSTEKKNIIIELPLNAITITLCSSICMAFFSFLFHLLYTTIAQRRTTNHKNSPVIRHLKVLAFVLMRLLHFRCFCWTSWKEQIIELPLSTILRCGLQMQLNICKKQKVMKYT